MLKNKRPQVKKVIVLVVGYLVLSIFLAGCGQREIKNINAGGKNIICFGDSITFGYGAEPGEDYPTALAKLMDVPVVNAGIDGDTSIEALKRLDSDVLGRDPLLVIIEFSGNDFLRKIPEDVTIKNITKMIEAVQEHGAMVAIVDISAGMLLGQYRQAFNQLAKETKSIFIPKLLSGIITNPNLKSDFIHPNADGYRMIAQKIFQVITPYLRENSRLKNTKK